jgi:hypothetical protein
MVNLPPDSRRYLAMHQRRVCRPFHLRWLLPLTLRANLQAWTWATRSAVVAIGVLTAVYTGSPWLAAVALLPAMTWNWHHPVMVDMVAMAWTLATALVAMQGWWWLALPMVLVAATMRETTPIWAAIYAWQPWLLVGLIPVAVRWAMRPGPDTWTDHNAYYVANPLAAGRDFHRGRWRDPALMVWPWAGLIVGVGLLAGGPEMVGGVKDAGGGPASWVPGWLASTVEQVTSLLPPTWWGWGGVLQLAVALACAYLPLLIATDSVRIYQWAAPVLALACVTVLPFWAIPLVALSIVVNPWRGPGT